MPTLTKIETAVKKAVLEDHLSEMEVQELLYNQFKIPFGELKEKFNELGTKLGFILSKEQKEKLVKTHLNTLDSFPTGYLGAMEIIAELSEKAFSDVTKLVKENWAGDFPKKEAYVWPTEGHYGQILKVIIDNPKLTIEEFKKESLTVTTKGNYSLDVIKFAKGFQAMTQEDFYNLFKS